MSLWSQAGRRLSLDGANVSSGRLGSAAGVACLDLHIDSLSFAKAPLLALQFTDRDAAGVRAGTAAALVDLVATTTGLNLEGVGADSAAISALARSCPSDENFLAVFAQLDLAQLRFLGSAAGFVLILAPLSFATGVAGAYSEGVCFATPHPGVGVVGCLSRTDSARCASNGRDRHFVSAWIFGVAVLGWVPLNGDGFGALSCASALSDGHAPWLVSRVVSTSLGIGHRKTNC